MMRRIILCVVSFTLLLIIACSMGDDHFTEYGFQGNYRVFITDELMGVIDSDGNVVVPPQYTGIMPIVGKYCVVRTETRYGLWDVEQSIELLPCEYESIEICNTMLVVDSRLFDPRDCSFVDLNRDYHIYYYAEESGLFIVYSSSEPWYGVVDLNGEIIFERPEELPGPGGLYLSLDGVITYIDMDNHFHFFDIEARHSIGDSFSYDCLFFNNGFAAVSNENASGMYLMNRSGERVSPLYRKISYNPMGTTAVSSNGWFAYNDGEGWYIGKICDGNPDALEAAIPIDADDCPEYLGCGVFAWYDMDSLTIYSVEKDNMVNLGDDALITPFVNNAAILETAQGYGAVFVNLSITSCNYNNITEYIGEFALVCMDDVWHPINREGLVDTEISFFGRSCRVHHGLFQLRTYEGRIIFIDQDAHIISMI